MNRHNPITTNATETIFIPKIENNFENSNANIPPINPPPTEIDSLIDPVCIILLNPFDNSFSVSLNIKLAFPSFCDIKSQCMNDRKPIANI